VLYCTGLLEGYDKLCLAAKQLAPLLQQLETEHLQRFNLTWEVLNKHLYQSCVYTDPLVQNNLPHYIGQVSIEMMILQSLSAWMKLKNVFCFILRYKLKNWDST
jgi:hypothetical protein